MTWLRFLFRIYQYFQVQKNYFKLYQRRKTKNKKERKLYQSHATTRVQTNFLIPTLVFKSNILFKNICVKFQKKDLFTFNLNFWRNAIYKLIRILSCPLILDGSLKIINRLKLTYGQTKVFIYLFIFFIFIYFLLTCFTIDFTKNLS